MMPAWQRLLLLLLLLLSVSLATITSAQLVAPDTASAASPPVKVQVRAPWHKVSLSHDGSPLLLEILEAANAQDTSAFFPLVTRITAPWSEGEGNKHRGKHHHHYAGASLATASESALVAKAEAILSDDELLTSHARLPIQLWRQSLALHDQSPRVQAFVQLYNTLKLDERWSNHVGSRKGEPKDCISWVDFAGNVLCDEDEVIRALESERSDNGVPVRLLPFEHVLPARDTSVPTLDTVLILYGDPYSSNFWRLHSLLEAYATGHRQAPGHPRIAYVLRWRPYPASLASSDDARLGNETEPIFLSSYGAILDLKKVDYLVIDDRKLRDDSEVGHKAHISEDSHAAETENLSIENRIWLQEQIGQATTHATSSQEDSSSLSKEELSSLGLRAAHLITTSSDPLRALAELSQNFPHYANALARSESLASWDPEQLIESLMSLSDRRLEPGTSDAWLNGKGLGDRDLNPLSLLATLRDEAKLVKPLLGKLAGGVLNQSEAIDLISSSLAGRAFIAASEEGRVFFDASDRKERELSGSRHPAIGAITWWNNLPSDPKTSGWNDDLFSLLRPMWPGQFPQLSLNLFNVIMVLDLSRRESCTFLAESIGPSVGRIGLHWGFVPGGLEDEKNDVSVKMARLFWEIFDNGGAPAATSFLRKVANHKGKDKAAAGDEGISLDAARMEAMMAMYNYVEPEGIGARLDDVVSGRIKEHQSREEMSRAYIHRLRAVGKESPRGHVFVNGQHIPFTSQLIQSIHEAVQDQIQILAPAIYYRQFTSKTDNLDTWFYDQPGTLQFRSKLASPPVSVDFESQAQENDAVQFGDADLVSALSGIKGQDVNVATLARYLYPEAADGRTPVNTTLWIAGDLDSREGASLVTKAIEAIAESKGLNRFRLGFLHVPRADPIPETRQASASGPSLSALIWQLLQDGTIQSLPPATLLETVKAYKPADDNLDTSYELDSSQQPQKVLATDEDPAASASEKGWAAARTAQAASFWSQIAPPVVRAIKLDASSGPAIVLNGHRVSGFNVDDVSSDDILALIDVETSKKVEPILKTLGTIRPDIDNLDPVTRADLVTAAISVMTTVYAVDEAAESAFVNANRARTAIIDTVGTEEHVFEVGDRGSASLRFSVVLDPLSENAQKWSGLFQILSKLEGVYLRVILNPKLRHDDLPLKRFYRFSAPLELSFDKDGKEVAEELRFHGMPENAVLTLGLDVLPTWLTMPEEAVYDLDNIRLSDVPSASRSRGVKAVYELKHLLIEGHARDVRGPIPRGLQLVLETPDGSHKLDTIVMANLAYFQFKAQPGLWKLAIRPGRSTQLYEMVSVGNVGWDSPGVEVTGEDITLDTLTGLTIFPRVKKRKGMEKEDLLEELDAQGRPMSKPDGETGGALGLAKSALQSAKKAASQAASLAASSLGVGVGQPKTRHADINIFTVASGHLYERMTYIMILSVIKHTESSVKFWFIENFLSPSFKEFIPHLAAEYGFEYELVTYAWPHWLRAQKEKQRTIWGYKILFLDTLFPLDLSKVIFVDADQVVRTDLKELVDLDLQGAPYGYPPMGDDSEDMDGYRFWKHGYWKDYLRGRPYHISALYVVDLNRFRKVAAGDRMRGQYQALSADPNSLANLDQDLPNNLQGSLPIHTLDKTWLWCETWCSKDWLNEAKTIDLCSNPKTKEPKLDRARRQIPEWTTYDNEVAALAKRLAERNEIGENYVDPEQVEVVDRKPAHDEL